MLQVAEEFLQDRRKRLIVGGEIVDNVTAIVWRVQRTDNYVDFGDCAWQAKET